MPSRRGLLKAGAAILSLGALSTSAVGPEPADSATDADPVTVGRELTDQSEPCNDPPRELTQPRTRNVQEYGAAGDGSADDTVAIQRALAAANDGDTIYFPSGEYTVGLTTSGRRGILRVPTGVTNLTITGDSGYKRSRVVVAEDAYRADDNFSLFRLDPRGVAESLTISDLMMDGNRPETGPSSVAIKFDPDSLTGGHSILVEDCWVKNFNGPALLFRQGSVVLNRITSIDNRQNFGVSERDDSTAGTDSYGIVITNSVSKNADWVGIDHNQGGRLRIDGLYSTNNGNSGLKTTKDNRHTRIENATFQSERNFAALRTNISNTANLPDPPLELSLDTVAVRDAVGGGIYLSGDDSRVQNSALLDGPVEVRNCGGKLNGSEGGLTFHSAAGGDVQELRVVGTADGPGVWFNARHELAIETLYHADNEGGAYEKDDAGGTLTVDEQINEDPGPLDTPTEDNVGAWSG